MATIVRTDLVAGSKGSVVTVRNGEDVLENGAFLALGALENADLGRSTRKVEKLKEGCVLAFLDDVALQYDERYDERDYQLKANKTARARRALIGEQVTIAKAHFEGSLAVGDELQVKADSYKLEKQSTGKAVAVILEDTIFEGQESYMIEFL